MSLMLEEKTAVSRPPIPAAIQSYLGNSYPNNHDYRVVNGKLVPRYKLCMRLRKLQPLYPRNMASLLDLSCSRIADLGFPGRWHQGHQPVSKQWYPEQVSEDHRR